MSNINKFGLFFELLAKMPEATKEEIVFQYSGGTSLSELYERSPKAYKQMISDMKKLKGDGCDAQEADMWRKRVIASVAGYFDKAGLYMDLLRRERLQKIMSTACRAAGIDDLNHMTIAQMKRVYSEFSRKQKVTVEFQKTGIEQPKESKRIIRRGCLSAEV